MTSTTSCFIPAASRAGGPAYSPEASTTRPGDAGETRAFEDLVPEDRANDSHAARDTAEPSDAPAEPVSADVDEAADDHEDERDERPSTCDGAALAALAAPSLLQTLLNSTTPTGAGVTVAPAGGPAENAATPPTGSNAASQGVPRDHPEGAPGTSPAVNPAAATKASRTARGPQAQPQDAAKTATAKARTADTSASGRPAKDASALPEGSATPARTAQGSVNSEPSGQPAVTRLVNTRAQGEKSAGPAPSASIAQTEVAQNRSVFSDNQTLAISTRPGGTRSAIPAATMSSSTTHSTQRRSEGTTATVDSQTAAGWTSTLSVDWKGWTNGGGERASTAAQFSQLGDKLSQAVLAASPASTPVARTAVSAPQSAAPAAPAVPVEVAEALAPIHSAIERLVLHGREQLSLTVRFEQGGSLSIKLAMNQGEIATQIQTDVPGLEAALKGAWGELAQDWNSRGWKLANPDISSSTPTYHQRNDASADARQGQRQARQQGDDLAEAGGRGFGPARARAAAPAVTLSGADALRAAALSRRGIHTWA